MRRSAAKFLPGTRGFTLLELVVVLVILAMIAAVVIPRLPMPGDAELERTARRLAATIRYLNDRAITSASVYRLQLLFAENGYRVVAVAADGSESATGDTLLAPQRLPEKISFRDVVTERQGRMTEGEISLPFGATGLAEFATIHLQDAKERSMTIFAFPSTGKVKVAEGYQEQPL